MKISASKLADIPKIFIIVSKFHLSISQNLLKGAIDILNKNGITEDNYAVVYVDGAYEIPIVLKEVLIHKKPDGVIVVGAIIKGETEHYYFLANSVIPKILDLSLEFKVPITNSIIVCENEQQGIERAGGKVGNRGSEAANALLNTLSIIDHIKPL